MFPSFVLLFVLFLIFLLLIFFIVMALKDFEFSKISSVCMKKRDAWTEFKAFICAKNFAFEVVYTDGLISSCKEDREGREPFGFILNNEIIRFDAPDNLIKLKDCGSILNKSLMFSGLDAYCPSYVSLRYIKKNLTKINRFIEEFGGDTFKAGWYASCSEIDQFTASYFKPGCNVQEISDKKVYAVHTTSPKDIGYSYATKETEVFIRVAYLLY